MMDPLTLAIPMAFIMLAALLCWHVISAKGRWPVKLALIVIVPSFGLMVWRAMDSYRGWPTGEAIPEKALVLWAEVREPDPRSRDAGAIYLWLVAYDDRDRGVLEHPGLAGEPRAYKLPYSRPMHEMVAGAKQMIRAGKPVVLERGAEGGDGTAGSDGSADGGVPTGRTEDGNGTGGDDRADVRFYELPAPAMPKKEPER